MRKKSTAILLDSFPFPPCSPVAEGQIDGTEVGHTIRVVCDMDDEDDDVLNEMPNFPMPPERTYTNVSSSSSSSNAPMIEVPQPIEEDRIILANVRVSVPYVSHLSFDDYRIGAPTNKQQGKAFILFTISLSSYPTDEIDCSQDATFVVQPPLCL